MGWGRKTWDGRGLTEQHGPGESGEVHEGDVEDCLALECRWPRVGGMVTVTSRGRRVTGSLVSKGKSTAVIETSDGEAHGGLLATATRPEWGTYCPHGTKIVEAVEADHTCQNPQPDCEHSGELGHLCIDHTAWCKACYPDGRKILPWPCDRCTEATFDREQQEMEEQYWEGMRREAYGL